MSSVEREGLQLDTDLQEDEPRDRARHDDRDAFDRSSSSTPARREDRRARLMASTSPSSRDVVNRLRSQKLDTGEGRSDRAKKRREEARRKREESRRKLLEEAKLEKSSNQLGSSQDRVEDDEKESREIQGIIQPKHIFPINIVSSRSTQNSTHPLLFVPYPRPHILNESPKEALRRGDKEPRRHEGTWEIETFGKRQKPSRNNRSDALPEESQHLLSDETDGNRNKLPEWDNADYSVLTEVECPRRFAEGLYTGRSAHLTPLLMDSEAVDAPVGHLVQHNVYLSRATQRLLREMHSDVILQYERILWSSMRGNKDYSEIVDKIRTRCSERLDGKRHNINNWSDMLALLSSFRGDSNGPGITHLLRSNSSNPTLRILENFIDYRVVQQIHPAISNSRLEFKSCDDKAMERSDFLGHIFSPDGFNDVQEKKGFTLKILAQEIVLMDHPYMSNEEQQYVELRKLFTQYIQIYQNKSKVYLPYRLLATILELKRLVKAKLGGQLSLPADKQSTESIRCLYNDMMETLPALCEFTAAWQRLDAAVYGQWRKIQDTRKQQGYSSTRVQLVARKVTESESQARDVSDGKLHEAFASLPQLIDDIHLLEENMESLDATQHDEDKKSATSEQRSVTPSTSALDMNKQVLEQKSRQRERVKDMLSDCLDYLRESSESLHFLPAVVYKLTSNGTITPDAQVPSAESSRRAKLRRLKMHVDLRVNGRVLASTIPQALEWPSLKVDVSKLFEMRIFRKPSDVVFDIYASYASKHSSVLDLLSRRTLIASVGVPLSQVSNSSGSSSSGVSIPALCFSPVVGWYHFHSNNLTKASKGRGISYKPNGAMLSAKSSVRVEGAILCGSEFDVAYDHHSNSVVIASNAEGVPGSELAFVSAGQAAHQRNLSRVTQGHADFTKEKDFFELLPALDRIDTNDPRNDNVVALQQQGIVSGRLKQRNIFQLGGKDFTTLHREGGVSYGHYLRLQPSDRLKLLRLREVKPYLFTFPIPLKDSEIKNNEVMKKLLKNELPGYSGQSQYISTSVDRNPFETIEDDLEGELMDSAQGQRNKKKVASFLQRVRDSQTAISRKTRKKQIVTQSVIFEPNRGIGVLSFEEVIQKSILPERKRALKPKEIERTPIVSPTTACELLVQVGSVRNIPLRDTGDGDSSSGKSPKQGNARFSGRRFGGESDTSALLERSGKRNAQLVSSFVEVSFQDHKKRTTTLEGQNPMWKQSVSLPFHPPQGDFSHGNLALIDEDVVFTLFDEYSTDDAHKGGYRDGESTLRTEKRYLGSFSIPFSTILSQQRVEGTFRLNTPPITSGYKRKIAKKPPPPVRPRTLLGMIGLDGFMSYQEKDELGSVDSTLSSELDWFSCGATNTYITVMATLDPLLSCSPYLDSEVTRATTYPPDRPLVHYTQGWVESLRSKGLHTKNRRFQCFGTNSDGLSVLVCRYLKAQKPPPGFSTKRSILHLVSLIPYIPDAQSFVGEFDLWCTMKQMWDLMGGDEEEHAIALYNFLYYLSLHQSKAPPNNKPSAKKNTKAPYAGYPPASYVAAEQLFLVIGDAVPEGSTVYVLMRASAVTPKSPQTSPQDFVLINPTTGFVYSAADPNCPLRDIGILATPYNLWANVQRKKSPKDLSFDVLNPKMWKPLFSARFQPNLSNLSSCQDDVLYHPTDHVTCLEVEKAVHDAVKENFGKWRSKRVDPDYPFNQLAGKVMSDILEELEKWKLQGGASPHSVREEDDFHVVNDALSGIESQVSRRMASVQRSHRLRGSPLNIPFTDVDAAVARVKQLGVHESNERHPQFVLAVRAFPLVNGLISLWIYLGELEPLDG